MAATGNEERFQRPVPPSLSDWEAFVERWAIEAHREEALGFVRKQFAKRLPVIFDLAHLGMWTDIDGVAMAAMVHGTTAFYRSYEIPKRSGGVRVIKVPYPSLLCVQRWILKEILQREELPESVHGFRAGRSIVTNARPHLGKRCVLKLDIRDFFPTIKLARVLAVFSNLGYGRRLSWAMARLCTLEGSLPQGAATSPMLANIVARNLDHRIEGLSKTFGLQYTRYADDLTFSGTEMSLQLPAIIAGIVQSEGFEVNEEKTRLMRGSSRKIVTGVSVGSGIAHMPRKRENS